MSEIHICIIFICILLLIIISLLCDTNTITKIKNTLLGGSTENEVGNIRNEIKKEQDKIDTIKSELQSMERNKPSNTEESGNTFGQQRKLPDKDDVDVSQLENNLMVALITPDIDIIPDAETLNPAYLVFDNYEIILQWNRSLRFALAVCTLKEKFENEL